MVCSQLTVEEKGDYFQLSAALTPTDVYSCRWSRVLDITKFPVDLQLRTCSWFIVWHRHKKRVTRCSVSLCFRPHTVRLLRKSWSDLPNWTIKVSFTCRCWKCETTSCVENKETVWSVWHGSWVSFIKAWCVSAYATSKWCGCSCRAIQVSPIPACTWEEVDPVYSDQLQSFFVFPLKRLNEEAQTERKQVPVHICDHSLEMRFLFFLQNLNGWSALNDRLHPQKTTWRDSSMDSSSPWWTAQTLQPEHQQASNNFLFYFFFCELARGPFDILSYWLKMKENCTNSSLKDYQHDVYAVVYSVILAPGLIFNILALWVFRIYIKETKKGVLFMMNLALSDLLQVTFNTLRDFCLSAILQTFFNQSKKKNSTFL